MLIDLFFHGIELGGEGAWAYKYIWVFFGIVVCCGLGVVASVLTKLKSLVELKNLVVGEVEAE